MYTTQVLPAQQYLNELTEAERETGTTHKFELTIENL